MGFAFERSDYGSDRDDSGSACGAGVEVSPTDVYLFGLAIDGLYLASVARHAELVEEFAKLQEGEDPGDISG